MYTAVTTKSKNPNWWLKWHLAPRAAVLGLFAHATTGCLIIDSGEGKDQPAVPSTYFVQVYDYKVTDVASGVTYASGCDVGLTYLGIIAKIPFDIEYMVEITAIRHQTEMANFDKSDYCQLPYEAVAVDHINPSCYQVDPVWDQQELIEASLVDADGNPLSSTTSFMIAGTTTDVEKYKLRSHAYGTVCLNYAGPPCNGSSSYARILIANQQP